MGTKTIPNGDPHGERDVRWGREVIITIAAITTVLLATLVLIVGAVVYNAREFAETNSHLDKVEAKVDSLIAQIALRVVTADRAHESYEKRIEAIEEWRYGQPTSEWQPGSREKR